MMIHRHRRWFLVFSLLVLVLSIVNGDVCHRKKQNPPKRVLWVGRGLPGLREAPRGQRAGLT
ncbi:MAG: hypothetical protein WCZ20_01680 [Hydrogenophaga sp.]|jgi:hypothetical protein